MQQLTDGDIRMDKEFELGSRFTEQQKQQIIFEEDNARLASQRRQEIDQIVNSIVDLNYIFKDLGRMIIEQVKISFTFFLGTELLPEILI